MAINLFGRDGDLRPRRRRHRRRRGAELDIPIHAFDLIIADECHRGYTARELSVWRETLDHFDAVKIGLTATPAAHTTAYFKDIVYRYEYERAVSEGYLVDYDVVAHPLRRPDERRLPQGRGAGRASSTPRRAKQLDLLEDERAFDTTEIEREDHGAGLEPEDPRGDQEVRRRARERSTAASRRP